jgi:hypothetical protein
VLADGEGGGGPEAESGQAAQRAARAQSLVVGAVDHDGGAEDDATHARFAAMLIDACAEDTFHDRGS